MFARVSAVYRRRWSLSYPARRHIDFRASPFRRSRGGDDRGILGERWRTRAGRSPQRARVAIECGGADAIGIESLRDRTPRPKGVRLVGRLDTISASRANIALLLEDDTRLLGEERFADTIEANLPRYRRRLYPPVQTLVMFVSQALSDDRSSQRRTGCRLTAVSPPAVTVTPALRHSPPGATLRVRNLQATKARRSTPLR